jgi:hypothetical protein
MIQGQFVNVSWDLDTLFGNIVFMQVRDFVLGLFQRNWDTPVKLLIEVIKEC